MDMSVDARSLDTSAVTAPTPDNPVLRLPDNTAELRAALLNLFSETSAAPNSSPVLTPVVLELGTDGEVTLPSHERGRAHPDNQLKVVNLVAEVRAAAMRARRPVVLSANTQLPRGSLRKVDAPSQPNGLSVTQPFDPLLSGHPVVNHVVRDTGWPNTARGAL